MNNLLWTFYRHGLVIFAVAIFFTNISDYSQNYGLIPLVWIVVFAGLCGPALLNGAFSPHVPIRPILGWILFYLIVTIVGFYITTQGPVPYEEVQKRFLAMIFLLLSLVVCSRPEEQILARKWIAGAVLLASALNIYELFNPLTFSTIPGRSTGLYTNVNQSGAALVLGLILSYHVIPDRLKMVYIAITAAGIIPTFSRSSMIGWLLVVGYFMLRDGFMAQVRRIVILSAVSLTLIFSPVWGEIQHDLEARGVLNLNVIQRIAFFTGGQTQDASSNERRAVASKAWEMYGERPIQGWGTSSSRYIDGFEVGTHNIYLAMIVDHGVIGFFIVPLLLLCVAWGANRKTIDQVLPWLMFMLIWGFFSHNVLEERYILLAAALLASMVASNRTRAVAAEPEWLVSAIPPSQLAPIA